MAAIPQPIEIAGRSSIPSEKSASFPMSNVRPMTGTTGANQDAMKLPLSVIAYDDVVTFLRAIHDPVALKIKPKLRACRMFLTRIVPSDIGPIRNIFASHRELSIELSPISSEYIFERSHTIKFMLVRAFRTSLHRRDGFDTGGI